MSVNTSAIIEQFKRNIRSEEGGIYGQLIGSSVDYVAVGAAAFAENAELREKVKTYAARLNEQLDEISDELSIPITVALLGMTLHVMPADAGNFDNLIKFANVVAAVDAARRQRGKDGETATIVVAVLAIQEFILPEG